jgi:hypothetical protein
VTRVLVCGGRMFGEVADDVPSGSRAAEWARAAMQRRLISATLAMVHVDRGITSIIHGKARKGADQFAAYWGNRMMIDVRPFPADWRTYGKAAGPIRNQRMIDEGKPDLVIAFPGGRGTADMIRRAEAAGIEVIKVEPSNG